MTFEKLCFYAVRGINVMLALSLFALASVPLIDAITSANL